MIPPLRVLDKIRRAQGITKQQVISLMGTRDQTYSRAISKQAGKTSKNRIVAYAYLLNFTEAEIESIVEYSERYNQYIDNMRTTKDDKQKSIVLALLQTTWEKLTQEEKDNFQAALTKITMNHQKPLPLSFVLVLHDYNNADRS